MRLYTALTLLLAHETGWIATFSDEESGKVNAIIRMRNTNRRFCVGQRVIITVIGTGGTVAEAIRTSRLFTDCTSVFRFVIYCST
jgi:hypothetical protein